MPSSENNAQQNQRRIDQLLTLLFFLRSWPRWITPNRVSFFRVLFLGPLAIFFVYGDHPWSALLVFLLAGLLDAVDGTLARVQGTTSAEGAYIDAIADKVINVPLIMVIAFECASWFAVVLAGAIACMAVALTTVRSVHMHESMTTQHSRDMRASNFGKWKMRLEVLSIALILLGLGITTPETRLTLCHLGALTLSISLFPFAYGSLRIHLTNRREPRR